MSALERLDRILEAKRLTRNKLAEAIGITEGAIRNAAKSDFLNMGGSTLYKIAQATGTRIESLLDLPALDEGFVDAPAAGQLPICFKAGAGNWMETDDHSQDVLGFHDGVKIQKYRRYKQWFEIIDGDSMNKILPSGSLVQVIDTRDMGGYTPKQDDIVIVERTRSGGFLRERSAKQANWNGRQLELWPRSNYPRWQTPITLNDHPEDETVTVEIVGLVGRAVIDFI